jgi:hypothetical protein
MEANDVQQQGIGQTVSSLLEDVYEGKLLLPAAPREPWGDERRLRLFEAMYHRLPVGSVVIWRTSHRLECRTSVGYIPLPEPAETQIHDYLVDGLELVEALFQELGPAFWHRDAPDRRRMAVAERPATFISFELETQTFRLCKVGDALLRTEFALARVLDPAWQHEFSAELRSPGGFPALQSRFSRLVDSLFGALLTGIRIVSENTAPIRQLLAVRGTSPPLHLLTQAPETSRWYCDTCGEAIRHAQDGWVEWLVRLEDSKPIGRGFRLVHHQPASPRPQGCQYDSDQEYQRDRSTISDVPLTDFLGHDGLTYLLEVLSRGLLPQEEVVEMIKRLHTPGYERARLHAQAAIAAGIIEPNMAPGFYWQRDIAAVLDWVATQNRKS